ncbi:MAG: hypothetical protein QOD92_216 [Acidimicrobiaceae bacterium]
MLSRRKFLTLSGGAAVTGAAAWAGLARDQTSSKPSPQSQPPNPVDLGRVLVVVQLTGGNDALNTVIPHDGRYHDLRPTLSVPDDQLVALSNAPTIGLHPALQPLVPLWDAGRLAILPQIGFAADSRSHFESLAAWWTASPEHRETTGWIGRWLDATGSAKGNPLAAIALGGGAVPALRAEHSQSTAVNDLAGFKLLKANAADAFTATARPVSNEPVLAQAQAAVAAATTAVSLLSKASAPASGETGPITEGLATAATLIDMDLGTRVFLVSGTGFDTHANQATEHEQLLGDLATGVASFFTALETSGRADQVLLLTTSEFGRRAEQNGSDGTDHGHGGVHFVAGRRVRGGLHGDIDLGHLVDGDLAAAVDTRSLYAAGLDWLGGPSAELLDGHTDTYGLLTA